jgi:hypothetical protein
MSTSATPKRACPVCGTTLVEDPTRQAKVGTGLVPISVCATDGAFWWTRWGPAAMSAGVLVPAEA